MLCVPWLPRDVHTVLMWRSNVGDSIVTIEGSNLPTLSTAEFLAFYAFNVRESLLYARYEFFFPFLSRAERVRLFKRAFLYLSVIISASTYWQSFSVIPSSTM